jgi:hypothetical protein
MRLPQKDSATWRAIITALQTFCGFLIALAAQPDTIRLINNFYPWIVPVIVSGAGVASFVLNFFRKSVNNY